MARHKWENNKCVKCGYRRKKINRKILMAVVNHPPWEGYRYSCEMAYSPDNFEHYAFRSPSCVGVVLEKNEK